MTSSTRIIVPPALDLGGLVRLHDEISRAAPGVPLVLIGGADVFCSGLSLEAPVPAREQASQQDRAQAACGDGLDAFVDALSALRAHRGATIAVVVGTAAGGGVGLAAAADVVLAAETARFSLPEVLLGLTPATIAPFLQERMTAQAFLQLMLYGDAIGAQSAVEIGLADRCCPAPDLDAELARHIRRLSRGAPSAIVAARGLASYPDLRNSLEDGAAATRERLSQPETQRRIAAWSEGRAPWHS